MNYMKTALKMQEKFSKMHTVREFRVGEHVSVRIPRIDWSCTDLLQLHVSLSYVRPILEYNTPVWLIQDIKCVERVQRFFTRALFIRVKLPTMSYTDRLANLGLHSLEYRRVYFDLVMCFTEDCEKPCRS